MRVSRVQRVGREAKIWRFPRLSRLSRLFTKVCISMNRIIFARMFSIFGLLLAIVGVHIAKPAPTTVKNSWRGITPLHSSAADVAQVIGMEADPPDAAQSGPYKVEGGEVTFSYLSPSLAKMYRAPRSMVGKVFTIYFKPGERLSLADLKLAPGFKRCIEQLDKGFYYYVNDAGVAYQLRRDDDCVETIIYQPSRVEVRQLAVNTECIF